MAQINSYLEDVNSVQDDLNDLFGVTSTVGTVVDTSQDVLELPGDIEDLLREKADKIDLPNSIVNVLSGVPYGIGTAVKQLDNIANSVSGTVDDQADVLGTLDDAWKPTRDSVTNFNSVITTMNTSISALLAQNTTRVAEANLLASSLGTQKFFDGSELASRMQDYSDIVDAWDSTLTTLMTPVDAAIANIQSTIQALDDLVPSVSSIRSTLDSALSVFNGAADIVESIEDALDINVNVGFFSFNVLDIIEDISDWASIVVNFVDDLVTDLLAALGININSVFNSIANQMTSIMDPVFDVLDDIQAAAVSLLGDVVGAFDDLQTALNNLLAGATEVAQQPGMFENIITGDADGLAVADDLMGTNGEDAMFGELSNDTLNGGFGDDFLFGGADGDTLIGGLGNDEMYGGTGEDFLIGIAGNNYYDGGADDDFLIAQSGNDVLNGGSGQDLSKGGDGVDTFVFFQGNEVDIVLDFQNDFDKIGIDADFGYTDAATFVAQNAFSFGGNAFIKNGDDIMIVVGLDSHFSLIDDIVFV